MCTTNNLSNKRAREARVHGNSLVSDDTSQPTGYHLESPLLCIPSYTTYNATVRSTNSLYISIYLLSTASFVWNGDIEFGTCNSQLSAGRNEDDYLLSIRVPFSFNLFCIWFVKNWIFKQSFSNSLNSTRSLLFVQFGKFVQLDVACPMKPRQTAQTCALSSTASEAISINLEMQGHRSGRNPRPDGREDSVDRPRRLKKNQGHRKPSFSSLFASRTTRPPTRWRPRSEVRSLYPRRYWPRGALEWRQPTQEIPRAIVSYPTLTKRVYPWPRRSGEKAHGR